jgi:ABC-type branched-subunit amino acid transport system ATPase component
MRDGVKRQWSLILVAIGFALVASPAWAADEIVLGSAISQTGKYAREGKLYDDQSDPNLAVRLFTKLVTSDKVNFLLGPYSSGITIPASAVAEKYEVPMVQGGGASGKIFDRGYKYIFGTLPKAEFYFQAAIEAAAKMNPPVRTAALLYSNEAFDRSVADGARQWLKDQKVDKIYDEEYQPATQDFTSILAVIKSKNPDLVLMAGHEEGALNFIRQSQAADVRAGSMSGGEQQMCAIARGLMARPRILILDELSLGLTPIMRDVLVDAIQKIRTEGTTIFVVEQDVATAFDLATTGYVLENGRVVLSGPTAELRANPHVKTAYLGL